MLRVQSVLGTGYREVPSCAGGRGAPDGFSRLCLRDWSPPRVLIFAQICFLDNCPLGLSVRSGGGPILGPVCGPGGAGARRGSGREGALLQMQGWELRSEWGNWWSDCTFLFGRWGEWQQKVASSIGPPGWDSLGHTNQTFSGHLLYSGSSTGPTLRCSWATGADRHMGLSFICLPLVLVCAMEEHGF